MLDDMDLSWLVWWMVHEVMVCGGVHWCVGIVMGMWVVMMGVCDGIVFVCVGV